MKQLYKIVPKYEGKKSQVAVGNVRETLKVLTAVLAAEFLASNDDPSITYPLKEEMETATAAMFTKAKTKFEKGFKTEDKFDEIVRYLLGIKQKPLVQKAKPRGKKTKKKN